MKSHFTLLIAAVVVLVLFFYMIAFQVRYDQVAVVQTFGAVEQPNVREDGRIDPQQPGGLKIEPGLYFKWPWPIQKVTTYSNKIQLLETTFQQVSTADGNTVVVKTYLAWRIKQPHDFFSSVGSVPEAQDKLRSMAQGIEGMISGEYALTDLVNNNPDQLRLEELEERFTQRLREELAQIQPSYGIELEQFGIRRIMLPEAVTSQVFRRMQATREAMAERIQAEGEAQAETITSQAESQRQQILAFARRQAQALRTQGDRAAAQYYDAFQQNEELAIFLRKLDTLENTLAHNSTFILNAENQGWLDLLQDGPSQPLQAGLEKEFEAEASGNTASRETSQ